MTCRVWNLLSLRRAEICGRDIRRENHRSYLWFDSELKAHPCRFSDQDTLVFPHLVLYLHARRSKQGLNSLMTKRKYDSNLMSPELPFLARSSSSWTHTPRTLDDVREQTNQQVCQVYKSYLYPSQWPLSCCLCHTWPVVHRQGECFSLWSTCAWICMEANTLFRP